MAMFLAGLRGVDDEIIKAAQIDGAEPVKHLLAHHHPAAAAGVPLSAFIILAHLAIKSFDLVMALTGGGPGIVDLTCRRPSCTRFTFTRNADRRWARPAP